MVKACDVAAEEEDGADVFSVKGRKYISASKEEESPLLYIERVRMSGPGERRELQIFCPPPSILLIPLISRRRSRRKSLILGQEPSVAGHCPGFAVT